MVAVVRALDPGAIQPEEGGSETRGEVALYSMNWNALVDLGPGVRKFKKFGWPDRFV